VDGLILHAARDGVHYLRLVGSIRYPLAPSLEKFLQNIFSDPVPPSAFLVDLSEAEIVDSSNLGVLAKLSKSLTRCKAPRGVLLSTKEDITEVLLSMGFDQYFQMVTTKVPNWEPPDQQQPIPNVDQTNLLRTILEAHQTLMEMNDRNEVVFREVVRHLEQSR